MRILLICVLALAGAAHAGEVQLVVSLSRNAENLGQHQLVVVEGKSGELSLEGKVRLLVNPLITREGRILLSMRVEEPAGSRWVEVAEPKLLVANGTRAETRVTSPKGNTYRIAIRPSRS